MDKILKIKFSDRLNFNKDNNFKLYREFILKNNSKVIETPKVISCGNNIDISLEDKYLSEKVEYFFNTVINNLSMDNKKILFNNINSLIFNKKLEKDFFLENLTNCFFNKNFTIGYYNPVENNIRLISKIEFYLYKIIVGKSISYKKIFEGSLYHEMFHVSSTIYRENELFSGFYQQSKKRNIGCGLNEGYTENLVNSFFPEVGLKNKSYAYEKGISMFVEDIIGYSLMNKYYFNADLLGVINELAKYNSLKEVKDFILNLDKFHYISNYNIVVNEKREQLIKYNNKINCFLIKSYINKIRQTNPENDDIIFEYYNKIQEHTRKYLHTEFNLGIRYLVNESNKIK